MTAPAGTNGRPARTSRPLAGTGALLRLALRRDRIMTPVWVLALSATLISGVGSIQALYGTAAERADLVRSLASDGSLRAMIGPVFDDSLGALVAWRLGGFAAIGAAVMSLVIVVRHTREEEETGRQELLSSAMVGRRAPLTAALLAALAADAALALIIALGLAGPTGSATGALALGLAIGLVGLLFACLAAVTAQLTESARQAKGLAAAALGAAYALRAAGDSSADDGSAVPTWLSPLGWAANVRPYAHERWWVLLLLTAAVLAQGAAAYALAGRRDVGMSFLPARPGPAEGRIATAAALAWRLQRGAVLGWAAAFLAAGIALGSMAGGVADLVGENEGTREIFERMGGQSELTDAFLAAMTGLFGMVAALFTAASVLRLHGEETSQRAEPVLAGAVGRLGWAAGHLLIAFGGSAAILLCAGLGLALGHGADFGPVMGAVLLQIPAVWLLGGVTTALWGALPKAATASWAVVGLCLAIGWIGPALNLPETVLELSPFGHLPKLPGGTMEWEPVLILSALTAALLTAGLLALRRRDLRV
ncbi:ABC transporter permease [Streptomyces jumonjinensis]|uniref:ABC transporter permease n=1 Tax=Streptomyces jumonjinensis TaxID=1945 RepID=A0A646KMX5_STRJU|nr:ABC transporter permease [Streptomyces jumonjinensis]MQT03397.1 ABC transporter permease [Streptomyces jumonjinensis]